jgi:hypothetical protein
VKAVKGSRGRRVNSEQCEEGRGRGKGKGRGRRVNSKQCEEGKGKGKGRGRREAKAKAEGGE